MAPRVSLLLIASLCMVLAFTVSADSGRAREDHPTRLTPPPSVIQAKQIADRRRASGEEVIDFDDLDDYDGEEADGRVRRLPMTNGRPFRKAVVASYALNVSVSGDLDANLHPTYYRTFSTQTVAQDWFAKRSVVMGLGTATHMDSPCHVYQEPCVSITDFNATQYTMRPLVVVDVTSKVFDPVTGALVNADYQLQVSDLVAWEQQHGRIRRGSLVAMKSGWSNRVYNTELYENRDAQGQKHFPGFGNDAIDWLLANRSSISGIAVDTSSVDAGINWSFHVHYKIAEAVKISVENLKLSNRAIPSFGAFISNLPVLHEGAPEATVASIIYIP